MPKLTPKQTLNDKLSFSSSALRQGKVSKVKTERQELVVQIWNSIPKPSRRFKTVEEQCAYQAGVNDERLCQTEYDYKLRDVGLR